MGRLAGKTAIITGGAGGMGEAHVRRFVREGATVHFTDVLREQGEALAAELGTRVLFTYADVASEADWAGVVATTENYGPVDILVNNAGIVIRAPIEAMSEADYRKVMDINQIGVFLGMKAVIPSMRRNGAGSIINISSIAGLVGRPQTVAYAASKFAVRGMTKVAASELGKDNIRVNSVHPGPVLTPMFENMDQGVREALTSQVPLGRMARSEEVSDLLVFLASDESTYCSGAEILIDGGMLAG